MTLEGIRELVSHLENGDRVVEVLKKAKVLKITRASTGATAICEEFMQANGTSNVTQTDKNAAKWLDEEYGADTIIQLIKVMAPVQGQPYVPSINKVGDIKNKWLMIKRYIERNTTREEFTF